MKSSFCGVEKELFYTTRKMDVWMTNNAGRRLGLLIPPLVNSSVVDSTHDW